MCVDMVDVVRSEFSRLGYAFFESGAYDLNLIGLRASSDESNLFDDLIVCVYKDEASEWQVKKWAATTDPGRPWLAKPMRSIGCAILVPGQYRGVYQIGTHNGKPALVQRGLLKVWRDNDKDTVLDRVGPVHDALDTGINIHRAGKDSSLVELWSAGCQVFKREADLLELMALAGKQKARGKGWDRFSYTLVDVEQSPALGAVFGLK